MSKSDKKNSYTEYREKIISSLVNRRTWQENGIWRRTGTPMAHILPVEHTDSPKQNRENRANAIKNYVNCDCKKCLGPRLTGLHQFAHHLNSSQQLCMKFFSELIDENRCATEAIVNFIKNTLEIDIHVGAKCEFEHTESSNPDYQFTIDKNGNLIEGAGVYEGTSFDFYIKDNSVEIFFEIKFTEHGFKKEKGEPHQAKSAKYLEQAPEFLKEIITDSSEFLKQYQIYRNIIRAQDSNKYVVFITDANNPATNEDYEMMKKLNLPSNIKFTTWQELISNPNNYPFELPLQLKAMQDYKKQ
ncbi:MAG: hypothetical protein HDR99_00725 [Bacteroides sp.]|nr:hypothetical protein [Bacteroides sp.]